MQPEMQQTSGERSSTRREVLAEKARLSRPGICFLCGCDYLNPCAVIGPTGIVDPCMFVTGTNRRLCTGHRTHEIAGAAAALKAADQEVVHA